MPGTVLWTGASGTRYTYWYYPSHTGWRDEPGNYIFARVKGGLWEPLYIGQAQSLKAWVHAGHPRWRCAKRFGMTFVHAHISSGTEAERRSEEADLLRVNHPPCNRQDVE